MPEGLILAAAQIDQWVGDVDGNVERMLAAAHKARDDLSAQVVVFPELSLIGYPPDDLLLRSGLPPAIEAAPNGGVQAILITGRQRAEQVAGQVTGGLDFGAGQRLAALHDDIAPA